MFAIGIVTLAALLVAVTFGSQRGSGQQSVEFKNGIPVAPTGLANRPLPKMPIEFDTGEGMRIRVSAVANGLAYPFGAAFLPDGSMLVTEREGHLRIIRNGVLDPQPVAGTTARRISPASRVCPARSTATWTWCCIRASTRTS
jgi:glucose/arabinose dehydrogenase